MPKLTQVCLYAAFARRYFCLLLLLPVNLYALEKEKRSTNRRSYLYVLTNPSPAGQLRSGSSAAASHNFTTI